MLCSSFRGSRYLSSMYAGASGTENVSAILTTVPFSLTTTCWQFAGSVITKVDSQYNNHRLSLWPLVYDSLFCWRNRLLTYCYQYQSGYLLFIFSIYYKPLFFLIKCIVLKPFSVMAFHIIFGLFRITANKLTYYLLVRLERTYRIFVDTTFLSCDWYFDVGKWLARIFSHTLVWVLACYQFPA